MTLKELSKKMNPTGFLTIRSKPLIYASVLKERKRQDKEWGEQVHSNMKWLGILMEEVGEVAKAILEGKENEMEKEIIEVAAVCFAWLENKIKGE